MKSPGFNVLSFCDSLVRHFETAALSASGKEYIADLTREEAAAICFFAGVPYSLLGGELRFHACVLAKHDGKWTAYVAPAISVLQK